MWGQNSSDPSRRRHMAPEHVLWYLAVGHSGLKGLQGLCRSVVAVRSVDAQTDLDWGDYDSRGEPVLCLRIMYNLTNNYF